MKTFLLALVLAMTGLELMAQMPPGFPANNFPLNPNRNPANTPAQRAFPRFPQPAPAPAPAPVFTPPPGAQPEETVPPGTIDFQGVDVNQVLDVYAKLVDRTVIRGALPDAKIILKTQTP